MERVELLERAQLAATDPAAVLTTLRTPRNEPVLTVVSRAFGGDSSAMNTTLPSLPKGQSYQLWRSDRGAEAPRGGTERERSSAGISDAPGPR